MDEKALRDFKSNVRTLLQLIDQELDCISSGDDFMPLYMQVNKLSSTVYNFDCLPSSLCGEELPFPEAGFDDILIF